MADRRQLPEITSELLESASTWAGYIALLERLMVDNKTTGPDQSEYILSYARLNLQRIRRIHKTVQVLPEVQQTAKQITQPLTLLFITEGWCGDAAQSLGVLEAIARLMPNTQVRVVLRDEHPDLIAHFLTNGGKAIPIVVLLDSQNNVLGHWGPRPALLQEQINKWKTEGFEKEQLIEQVHVWYTHDKTHTTQLDFLHTLQAALN